MSLSVLIALVGLGIAGIAALTHLMGLSRTRRFDTDAAAIAAWQREFPDTPVRSVTLCPTGRAALVTTKDGTGVVWAMGADSVARPLDGARAHVEGNTLVLDLPDYGAPHVRVDLGADDLRIWTQRMTAT